MPIDKDLNSLFLNALKKHEESLETPLRQLTRQILNEERRYLYSEQNVNQRKKNIRTFIEKARQSGNILSKED
jgi:hypothetical protein